jgi:hypothetical protein
MNLIGSKWNALTPLGKLIVAGILAAAVLFIGVNVKARWDVWRSGIHKAQERNSEAIRELSEKAGALRGEREATADALSDYERTQQSLAETAKLAGEFKRQAVTAQSAALAKDRRIAELEAQLVASDAKRRAQPKISNIQEAQDALANIDPRFR